MELSISTKAHLLIVSLNGRLDATNAEETNQKIISEIDKGYAQIILDMENMEYLSSAGIRVLITVSKKIKSLNGEIKMAALQDYPLNVLKISGFLSIFEIFETLEAAEKSFSSNTIETQTNDTIVAVEKPEVRFQIQKESDVKSIVNLIGDYKNFTESNCDAENLVSQKISDIQYTLGIGAISPSKAESLDHLGEIMFVKGTAIWVEPDGKNIPDFLKSIGSDSDIQVHSPYMVSIGNEFNDIIRFEAKNQNKGLTLKALYTALLDLASEQNQDFKGLISCVIRADVDGVFGASIKKPPVISNKPTSGNILDRENIRQWLQYNLDATYENSSAIIVGLAIKGADSFEKSTVKRMFNIEDDDIVIHNHGAIFKFIPEDRNTFNLDGEVDKVLNNSELVGMQHLLENTTLKKGIIGINYIQEVEIK